MKFLKKYLLDILVVIAFAIISFVYFMPADMDGRILFRHDAAAGKGLGHEKELFQQQTGETTRWTNSVFGGMPTYQMSPSYDSNQVLSQIVKAYHLWLPDYVWYVFVYLLGFYIMLRAFNFRQSLAALGSIIWAFSSYFFIIIAAGHIWKVWALAYLPPMIAGVVLAYRGKYLKGLLLTAIFSAFEVQANHVQMTYYYLFIILFMVIAFLADAIKKGELARFGKATAVCVVGALIGISLNLSNLYHTWQYGQETMRGKSELVKKNAANQTSSGLDRDYITQWSYGIDETWTLMIPNAKGGASVPLAQNQQAMEKADPNFVQIYQQLGQYWGNQPGTSGPVYVGAFVCMLFILGLFIVVDGLVNLKRALELRRFRPVGEVREEESDFRLVAATNRDLDDMVGMDLYRSDLRFRLRGMTIHVPPLRRRAEDIPLLAEHFTARYCQRHELPNKELTPDCYAMLADYSWPGNVRELRHTIERACAAAGDGTQLFTRHLPTEIRIELARKRLVHLSEPEESAPTAPLPEQEPSTQPRKPETFPTLRDMKAKAERDYIAGLFAACQGDVRRAAGIAGVSRGHFYELLKKYGLDRTSSIPEFPAI